MVLARGRCGVSSMSSGHDRDLRPVARDAGGVRIADRDRTIGCYGDFTCHRRRSSYAEQ